MEGGALPLLLSPTFGYGKAPPGPSLFLGAIIIKLHQFESRSNFAMYTWDEIQ